MHHSRHILVVSCSLQNKKNYPTTLDHLPASLISLAIFSNMSNNFKHTPTHRLYSIVPQIHQQFITRYQLWSLINYLFNKTSSYSSQLFSYTSLELCLRAIASLILSTNLLSSGQHVDNKIGTHRHTEHTHTAWTIFTNQCVGDMYIYTYCSCCIGKKGQATWNNERNQAHNLIGWRYQLVIQSTTQNFLIFDITCWDCLWYPIKPNPSWSLLYSTTVLYDNTCNTFTTIAQNLGLY